MEEVGFKKALGIAYDLCNDDNGIGRRKQKQQTQRILFSHCINFIHILTMSADHNMLLTLSGAEIEFGTF